MEQSRCGTESARRPCAHCVQGQSARSPSTRGRQCAVHEGGSGPAPPAARRLHAGLRRPARHPPGLGSCERGPPHGRLSDALAGAPGPAAFRAQARGSLDRFQCLVGTAKLEEYVCAGRVGCGIAGVQANRTVKGGKGLVVAPKAA